jgi:hypothetical protein
LRGILVPACEALDAVCGWDIVIKPIVAVVDEGGSSIMTCTQNISTPHPKYFLSASRTRNVVNGSGLNQGDLSTLRVNGSTLEVACPRRELERKFEIFLLAENAWMDPKSSANQSQRVDLQVPVYLIPFRATSMEQRCVYDVPYGPSGIGAEQSGNFLRTASEVLTPPAVLL